MKELYGIDIALQLLVKERPVWMKLHIPGWVNFGVLRHVMA